MIVEPSIEEALGQVRDLYHPQSAEGVLAAVVARVLLVHKNTTADTPFTHGMRAAAKLALGRIPVPPEWEAPR